MAQTSGFDPTLKVKTCFDCKMFDFYNWVAHLNREDGPRGMPSYEALSVSFQGALEISSVIRQPLSLVRDLFSSPRVVAKSCQCYEGCGPSSQDHNIQIFTDASNEGRVSLYKRSVVRQGKKAAHKCSRVEGSISGPERFKDQCQNQTVLVATDNSTVVANINKNSEPSPVNRMVTASAGVQTDLSKWFTPHVDLFAPLI